MRQGMAQSSKVGSTKVEPKPKAVNIEHVADMGLAHIRGNSGPMYEGRGLEAPMSGTTIHKSGSQGKR